MMYFLYSLQTLGELVGSGVAQFYGRAYTQGTAVNFTLPLDFMGLSSTSQLVFSGAVTDPVLLQVESGPLPIDQRRVVLTCASPFGVVVENPGEVANWLVPAVFDGGPVPYDAFPLGSGTMVAASFDAEFLAEDVTAQLIEPLFSPNPMEPTMSIQDTIAPLGHTIIALDQPITTLADAQAWAQHLEFVSGPVEQHGAVLVVPFADLVQAEAFAAMDPVKTSYRIMAVCYAGASGQEPELAASVAAALADSADPALPFNGVNLPGLTPVEPQHQLSRTRIEQALQHGVCMVVTGPDGVPEIVRALSTYSQTPEGEADDLLLDINGALVLDYVRSVCRRYIRMQPRRKNTERTRRDLRSGLLGVCMKLDDAEILKNVRQRKDALTVLADPNDEYRANVRIPADWVRGMHVVAATLDVY